MTVWVLLFKTCRGLGQEYSHFWTCAGVPAGTSQSTGARNGGWCTNGFLNHSEQTTVKRTNTVSLTDWNHRDLFGPEI